jgi:hypothetical protein
MDNRIRQILISAKSKQAVNADMFTNVAFESNRKLLSNDDNNYVLDVSQQFNTERQNSTYYRISGKINPLISNVLFNTTSTQNSWQIFSTPIFTATGYGNELVTYTFEESIQNHLKEIDGWYGYFDPVITKASLCNYYDMEPRREKFFFTPDNTNLTNNQPTINWDLSITYPYSSDTLHPMINGGLLIIDKNTVIVGGKPMTALSVPVKHNLNIGDTITLMGTNYDGTYDIKRVGLDDGTLQDYYFCIDIDFASITLSQVSRMSKLYNGVASQYYFRKFKKIKTRVSSEIGIDDYEIYKLAFSENIYTDDITQFVFNEDIDVSNLTDNLGRPLSQLYLTIVKTDSNGFFTPVSSGIEAPLIPELNNNAVLNYLSQIPVIQKIHNIPSYPTKSCSPLENNVLISNDDFYGDVVEYNITTIQEVVLADVYHRFNTMNRETTGNSVVAGPRPEGYYYKAHNLIQIRYFSSFIEQGDDKTVDMPDYKEALGDGTYIWRELLDIGVNDFKQGMLNYPFLNGCHYLYDNYCFDVRRQDPFDNWGLYFFGFPADPLGDRMTIRFNVNQAKNVC